mgnify:CR=1 FL=1
MIDCLARNYFSTFPENVKRDFEKFTFLSNFRPFDKNAWNWYTIIIAITIKVS